MEISKLEIQYSQPMDTCSNKEHDDNYINICYEADYLVISTDRWALNVDEIDKFADKLKAVAKQAIKENKNGL